MRQQGFSLRVWAKTDVKLCDFHYLTFLEDIAVLSYMKSEGRRNGLLWYINCKSRYWPWTSILLGRKTYLTSCTTGRKTSDIKGFSAKCTLHCFWRQDGNLIRCSKIVIIFLRKNIYFWNLDHKKSRSRPFDSSKNLWLNRKIFIGRRAVKVVFYWPENVWRQELGNDPVLKMIFMRALIQQTIKEKITRDCWIPSAPDPEKIILWICSSQKLQARTSTRSS